MMALAFAFLLMPICATIAGFVVWASNRDQSLDDGDLIRHFLFILFICIVLVWGGSKTDTVRLRLDPQFRLQTELDAHPVYSTLKYLEPDDHKELHNFLALQMSHGETLSDAFLQARPLLTKLTNHHLGFADQKSRLMWGRVTVDTLKELQTIDPMLCYRALSSIHLNQQELAQAFSANNTKAFQQAVIDVYEFSSYGSKRDGSPRHEARPKDDTPIDFNIAAREYSAIKDAITQRFGEPVSKRVARREFPEPPIEPPEQMCSARIFQLETMLEEPPAMAYTLIDSVLR